MSNLPTEAQARKNLPIYSGVMKYFPDALAAVAECSKKGNDQHNPGQPLHWDRSKSQDELDALTRHLMEAGTIDTDGIRHSAKVAWRALANLQKEIEREAATIVTKTVPSLEGFGLPPIVPLNLDRGQVGGDVYDSVARDYRPAGELHGLGELYPEPTD